MLDFLATNQYNILSRFVGQADSKKEEPEMAYKNEFSWSKSRHGLFRECKRKYYYDKYASWGGWFEDAPQEAQDAYLLKKLKTFPLWAGDVVHRALRTTLENLRAGVTIWEKAKIVDNTLKKMRAEFLSSKEGNYHRNKKTLGLFEHEYGVEGDEDLWRDYSKHVAACLTNFYDSDLFEELKKVSRDDFLAVEDLDTFDFNGTPIYVRIDCAIRGEGVHIYDWKTGKTSQEDASVQLACYALYFNQKRGFAFDEILAHLYYLFLKDVRTQGVTKDDVRAVKADIEGSIADMRSLLIDIDANTPREETAFVTTDNRRACRRCNFQRVCPAV